MTIDAAFTTFPVLTTERLLLRQVEPRDAEDVYATYSDEETMRYYGETMQVACRSPGLHHTAAGDYARRDAIRWGITRQDDDTLSAPAASTTSTRDTTAPRPAISSIAPIGVRASWARRSPPSSPMGLSEMGLHRIEAIIDIANERSKGCAAQTGLPVRGQPTPALPLPWRLRGRTLLWPAAG